MHIPSEPSRERVHSGGIDYAVHVLGEGPPVLLLHGFPETHWSFAHNWDAIADSTSCLMSVADTWATGAGTADFTIC